MRCVSGVCSNGECADRTIGHVVLIGHDYASSRPPMDRILGNAAFLSGTNPVRVLAFEAGTRADLVAGADAAIDTLATATGRRWQRNGVVDPNVVTAALADADVLLVYPQTAVTGDELELWGTQWSRALATFLGSGGVLIVLESADASNHRLLTGTELVWVNGRVDVTGAIVSVVAPGDAVALGLPRDYLGERSTVRFDTEGETVVVSDGVGAIVVHRTVLP
jgi:hypothetical protein